MNMLVSVYMPTRNRRASLQEAVGSVFAQSYPSFELIVVNDGSTDGTYEFLEKTRVDDSRIRIIHNVVPMGAPKSRNLAIRATQGEFVTGLDDDDKFHPERLAAFVDYWRILERAGEEFSCLYSQDIELIGGSYIVGLKPGAIKWQDLFFSNNIGNQIFAKRHTFLAAGLFDEKMPAWQDLDLFIRILKQFGSAKLLDAALYIMNKEPCADRISSAPKKRILEAYRMLEAKWRECPPVLRQGLYMQVFSHYYGHTPNLRELISFFRMGVHLKTMKALANVYLRPFRTISS